MARYIDADALQAQLERKKAVVGKQRYTDGWNDCMMRVKSMVSKAPAVDATSIAHGYWIMHDDELGLTCECSVCHIETMCDGNYCPNCGAKMNGGNK